MNLHRKTRNEPRNMTVSPKLIQQHVFNTFADQLKSFQHRDVTLNTKARSVHSVAAMI
jgi:hypothetical protein